MQGPAERPEGHRPALPRGLDALHRAAAAVQRCERRRQRRGELLHVGRSVRHARVGKEHADQYRERVRRPAGAQGWQVRRPARAVSDRLLHEVDGRPDRRPEWRVERQGVVVHGEHARAVPHGDRQRDNEQGVEDADAAEPAGEMNIAAGRAGRAYRTGAVIALLASATLSAQRGAANGEWRTWGGDLGVTRYAPLDQITAENFNKLQVAWRFKTDNLGSRPDFNLQTTPLMINGVLYATVGEHRNAVAINAATGEMLWMHRLEEGQRASRSARRLSGRGVGYWTDGKGDERIFYVTIGYQLVGLSAKDGVPLKDFGVNGVIDLKKDNDQEIDPIEGEVAWNGAPVVAKNVVIVGASHRAGSAPRSMRNTKGYVRGYDAKTGKRLWIFHTIPVAGEFGNDTWLEKSWEYTGNTGM